MTFSYEQFSTEHGVLGPILNRPLEPIENLSSSPTWTLNLPPIRRQTRALSASGRNSCLVPGGIIISTMDTLEEVPKVSFAAKEVEIASSIPQLAYPSFEVVEDPLTL